MFDSALCHLTLSYTLVLIILACAFPVAGRWSHNCEDREETMH